MKYIRFDEVLIKASLTGDTSEIDQCIEQIKDGIKEDYLRMSLTNEMTVASKIQQLISNMPCEFHEKFVIKISEVLPFDIVNDLMFTVNRTEYKFKSNKELIKLVEENILYYETNRKNPLRKYLYSVIQHQPTLAKIIEIITGLILNEGKFQLSLFERNLRGAIAFFHDLPPVQSIEFGRNITNSNDFVNECFTADKETYNRIYSITKINNNVKHGTLGF